MQAKLLISSPNLLVIPSPENWTAMHPVTQAPYLRADTTVLLFFIFYIGFSIFTNPAGTIFKYTLNLTAYSFYLHYSCFHGSYILMKQASNKNKYTLTIDTIFPLNYVNSLPSRGLTHIRMVSSLYNSQRDLFKV